MRSSLSGSIATCLIFVPLVAVPLLAVFGMPQISASAPIAAADDLKFTSDEAGRATGNADLLAPVRVSDPKTDAPATRGAVRPGRGEADPFAEFNRAADEAHAADTRPAESHSGTEPSRAMAQSPKKPQRWVNEGSGLPQKAALAYSEAAAEKGAAEALPAADAERGRVTSPEAPTPKSAGARRTLPEAEAVVLDSEVSRSRRQPSDPATADEAPNGRRAQSGDALTWTRAVARLNELGIRDFQLQAGAREGEFLFCCRLVSRSNPRVMHRFEAEAADPLDAVAQVLQQVDDWKAKREGRNGRVAATDASPSVTLSDSPVSDVDLRNR